MAVEKFNNVVKHTFKIQKSGCYRKVAVEKKFSHITKQHSGNTEKLLFQGSGR